MINSELIPSGSNSVLGADYQFEDTGVLAGETYYYWLEMVGIYGPEMLAGPASTTVNNYLYMPLVVR
jgi:hypothetical protein